MRTSLYSLAATSTKLMRGFVYGFSCFVSALLVSLGAYYLTSSPLVGFVAAPVSLVLSVLAVKGLIRLRILAD